MICRSQSWKVKYRILEREYKGNGWRQAGLVNRRKQKVRCGRNTGKRGNDQGMFESLNKDDHC